MSEKLAQLIVELEAKTKQFRDEFGAAEKQIKEFEKAAKTAEKATKFMENGLDNFGKGARKAGDEAKTAADGVKKLGDEAKNAEKKTTDLAQGMRTLSTTVRAAEILFTRTRDIGRALFDMMETAARSETAQKYFEDSGKSIERFREATGGLVSDAQIYQKINLGDSLGLTASQMEKMSVIARAASAKTGQSFEYMFDSIVKGEARASKLILDNLGIIFSAKEIYLDQAKKIKEANPYEYEGITLQQIADNLDDVAKKQAVWNGTLKATEGQLLQFQKLGEGNAATFDKLRASWDNFAAAIGRGLLGINQETGYLQTLVTLLNDLTDAVNAIGKADWKSVVGTGLNGLLALNSGFNPFGDMLLEQTGLKDKIQSFGVDFEIVNLHEERDALLAEIKKTEDIIANQLAKGMPEYVTQGYEAVHAKLLEDLADLNAKLGIAARNGMSLLPDYGDGTSSYDDPNGMSEGSVDTGSGTGGMDPEKRKALQEENARKAAAAFEKQMREAERDYDERFALWKQMADKEAAVREEMAKQAERAAAYEKKRQEELAKLSDDYEKSLAELAEANRKAAEDASKALSALFNDIGGALLEGDPGALAPALGGLLGDAIGPGITSGIDDAINLLFGSLAGGTDAAGAGAISTAFVPPELTTAVILLLVQLIASLEPVIILFQDLSAGLVEMVDLAFGPLLATLVPLGPALARLMEAFGRLIGAIIGPLLPVVNILVAIIVFVADAITMILTAITPVAHAFDGLLDALTMWSEGIYRASETMINGAIKFYNGFVDIINKIRRDFDFLPDRQIEKLKTLEEGDPSRNLKEEIIKAKEILKAQMEATVDNTAALNNLAREFRNLPQGYKVESALYESTNPSDRYGNEGRGGRGRNSPAGNFGFQNVAAAYGYGKMRPNTSIRDRFRGRL